LENTEYNLEILNNFSDSENISENRRKYVAIAVENGYMSGNDDGTFCPQKVLTRAEGATVICNILDKNEQRTEKNIVNWDGEYISNIDGLVRIKLTKISDAEVNFYIKGVKNGQLFAANENAVISGNTAKYEYDMFEDKGEINFRFEKTDLIIETTGYENLGILAGEYKVDEGTITSIETTVERNPLEGTYLLGEEMETTPEINSFEELEQFLANAPLSVSLEISNVSEHSASFTMGGFANESMVVTMGTLEMSDGKWRYLDEYGEAYTLEIELKDDVAVVKGLTEDTEKLSGIYSKKAYSPAEEYKKYEKQLDETELYGGFMF